MASFYKAEEIIRRMLCLFLTTNRSPQVSLIKICHLLCSLNSSQICNSNRISCPQVEDLVFNRDPCMAILHLTLLANIMAEQVLLMSIQHWQLGNLCLVFSISNNLVSYNNSRWWNWIKVCIQTIMHRSKKVKEFFLRKIRKRRVVG